MVGRSGWLEAGSGGVKPAPTLLRLREGRRGSSPGKLGVSGAGRCSPGGHPVQGVPLTCIGKTRAAACALWAPSGGSSPSEGSELSSGTSRGLAAVSKSSPSGQSTQQPPSSCPRSYGPGTLRSHGLTLHFQHSELVSDVLRPCGHPPIQLWALPLREDGWSCTLLMVMNRRHLLLAAASARKEGKETGCTWPKAGRGRRRDLGGPVRFYMKASAVL